MGNNAAFTAFEATVVALYDKGVLDQDVLSVIMETYRGTDIDCGGKQDLLTKDGLDVEDVVVKTFGLPLPERPALPDHYKEWTDQDHALNEAYHESRWDLFDSIAGGRFGWR